MAEATILLHTPSGSRLYGMAHANSDFDFITIYDSMPGRRQNRSRQSMNQTEEGMMDNLRMNLNTFLHYADAGHPQPLEAMFSQQAQTGPLMAAIRATYRLNLQAMRLHYASLMMNSLDFSKIKHRRHCLRWALNYDEATRRGRFNPTLTPEQAQYTLEGAQDEGNFLALAQQAFPYMSEQSWQRAWERSFRMAA